MPRIISLIASATEMLHALDLGEFQVGRSHECDYPPSVLSLPVCTKPRIDIQGSSREIDQRVKDSMADAFSVYEVFSDVIERLQPTHLLTQTQCRVCAVSLEDVERALSERHSGHPQVVALEPNSLADIHRDILRVAKACGAGAAGESLAARIESEMDALSIQTGAAESVRVAVIEWIEPLMAAGNWIPELLDRIHATDVFGQPGRHSGRLEFEQLLTADPDVILIAPCGFDLERTRSETYWLTERPEWTGLRAVRNGRVYLADANQYITRPGPRVVDSLRILAEVIHPALVEPAFQGTGWEPL